LTAFLNFTFTHNRCLLHYVYYISLPANVVISNATCTCLFRAVYAVANLHNCQIYQMTILMCVL